MESIQWSLEHLAFVDLEVVGFIFLASKVSLLEFVRNFAAAAAVK